MSIPFSPLQKGLSLAFSRLQIWFDPAQTGSPYETPQSKGNKRRRRLEPFFSKKLSIRV